MRKVPPSSRPNLSCAITNSTLFLLGAITSFALIMRKNKRPSGKTYKFNPNDPVPYLPGTNPHHSSTFYRLRLSKKQYEVLKSYGGKMLVFQFFYPQASNCGSPTLVAYKMKKHHEAIEKSPEVLSYDEPSQEPLTGRSQVLGDQQIRIGKLDDLIKRVTRSEQGNFSNLVFTPRFTGSEAHKTTTDPTRKEGKETNPHVVFEVTVDGFGDSERCDPSPPYSAY